MLVRRIARPMLASIFVAMGADAVRDPSGRAVALTKFTENYGSVLPDGVRNAVDSDPENIVRANGLVHAGGGLLLATGKFPRVAAGALAGSMVPTTVVGHDFWNESDPAERQAQMVHFLKNLGLTGGLLLASVDTEGKPSLGWRGRRAVSRMQDAAASAKSGLPDGGTRRGGDAAGALAERGAEWAEAAEKRGAELADVAAQRGSEWADVAGKRGGEWMEAAKHRGAELAETARKRGAEWADVAEKRGAEWADAAGKHGAEWADTAGEWAETAGKRGGKWLERAQSEAPKARRRARVRAEKAAKRTEKAAKRAAKNLPDAKSLQDEVKKNLPAEVKRPESRRFLGRSK